MYSASSLCNTYCREQFYSYRFRLKEFVCACFLKKEKEKRKVKQKIWEKTAAYLGQLQALGNKAIVYTHRLLNH